MPNPVLWTWCPIDVLFKPKYQRSANTFGAQSHEYGSPYWECELTLPPVFNELLRRDIENAIHTNDGRGLFGVFDRRCSFPYLDIGATPPLVGVTVTEMSKANSTLTLQSAFGQITKLTKGDPIAFTYLNRRYYFKVAQNVTLSNATPTVVEVFIRPRTDATGLFITTDRLRPVCYFNVDVNPMEGVTQNRRTPITLSGVEYWGEIT